MTVVDWVIVGLTLLMAVAGYSLGLIIGALSLAGFLGGALVGSRLAPQLLEEGSRSPYAPLVALGAAVLGGAILASALELVGFHLRRRLGEGLGVLDGLGGAILVACLALALAWIAGAVALQTPGIRELREPIQRSAILRELNEALPPSGPILQALARFDPLPEIRGPRPDVRPPKAAIARDPQVQAAGRSVVKVLGNSCGLGVQGSGWIAGDDLVVTNAHVVAGQDDTTVQLGGGGRRYETQPVWFDPKTDVAVLRAQGLGDVPALPLTDAPPGTSAAILGFPENGGFDVEPGRLGETTTIKSQNIYGEGPVRRPVTLLRGDVRSGNSGGPVVDGAGRVVTTVFAATAAPGSDSGYGVPSSIVRKALAEADEPVDTGPCAG